MGSSAITDEMRSMLGVEVGPEVYEIEKGMIKKFAVAMDDSNPLWQNEEYAKNTKYGGIIAPSTFVMSYCHLPKQEDWIMSVKGPFSRLVNGGCAIENYQVVRPGDVISVTGKLIELNEREGKKFGSMIVVIFERVFKNQRGETVAKGQLTFIKY